MDAEIWSLRERCWKWLCPSGTEVPFCISELHALIESSGCASGLLLPPEKQKQRVAGGSRGCTAEGYFHSSSTVCLNYIPKWIKSYTLGSPGSRYCFLVGAGTEPVCAGSAARQGRLLRGKGWGCTDGGAFLLFGMSVSGLELAAGDVRR